MAGFAYTNQTNFQPFSFDEMLKPMLMYTQAHREVEDAYADLQSQADEISTLANEQNDPIAYGRYKAYSDSLREQADVLSREGLTPTSRKSLSDLRNKYKKYITPIQTAAARRRELADEQRKLRAQDKSILFERDFNSYSPESSLDRFIEDPNYTYGDIISGNQLTQETSKIASNLQRVLRDPAVGRLDNFTKTLIQNYGLSPQEILNAMDNPTDPNNSKALSAIYNQVLQTVPKSIRDTYGEQVSNYITEGFWDALGQSKLSTFDDYGAKRAADLSDYEQKLKLQNQYALNLAREKARLEGNQPTQETGMFMPRIIEGAEGEVSEVSKKLQGLRQTSEGYSTIALDNINTELQSAQKELDKFMSDKNLKNYQIHEQYVQQQRMAGSTAPFTSHPEGYNKYKKLKDKVTELQSKYNTELKSVQDLANKYSHLGNTDYERLAIGSRLEEMQQKQEKSSFPLNAKKSDYSEVRRGIINILNSIPESNYGTSRLGIMDSKGNPVDYDDIQKMLDSTNEDKLHIKVTGGINPELKLVYEGKEYSVKGIQQLDAYNKNLKTVNNYLKDFSSDIARMTTEISPETFNEIKQKGIANTEINNLNIVQLDNNYKATVLHDASTGEYIKLLLDNSGNLVAANSLSDELTGGANRDSYFINMANKGLRDLIKLVATDYEDK